MILKKKTPASPLLAYMAERHSIWERRDAGQKWPWTDDPILREYSFTNVYRELDAVTIWIRKNIRDPWAHHSNLWFMLAIARVINWPPTLREIIDAPGAWPVMSNWGPKQLANVLDARRARGEKIYTGAYMIHAEPSSGGSKSLYIAGRVLGGLYATARPGWNTIQAATENIKEFHGWGGFMAYEVATDLRHTRYLAGAPDKYTYANAGPGAIRGLNRLHERDVKRGMTQGHACEEMQTVLLYLSPRWEFNAPRLEMRDVEHSLCEFDKYERVRLGQGRPRSKYREGSKW